MIARLWLVMMFLLALPAMAMPAKYDSFVPAYNKYVREWLDSQARAKREEIAENEARLATATDEQRPALAKAAETLAHDAAVIAFRQSLGDYFATAPPSDIPSDLQWQDGMDQPEIGDPRAIKGGTLRRAVPNFPPTIAPFGENSNHEFRGEFYDFIDIPLVAMHPETLMPIPGLAKQWAVSADGRTVYFRLNPTATYSNGEPVRAADFPFGAYVRISDDIFNPAEKKYFREKIARITVYDEHTLSVTLPEARLYPVFAATLPPACPSFYRDYGPDCTERYQWSFPPTTGAYEIRPGDIVKGSSITQRRVPGWWARDLKYYRYRFNVDLLVNQVIRSEPKAFELFRAGDLDSFFLSRPELWYEKCQIPEVYNGYIERTEFYSRYPKLPRGFYMNVTKPPLDKREVRTGIQHALNWDKVISVLYRGDYRRLDAFNQGYPIFSDPSITARPYSVAAARADFASAGYTTEGSDGILRKPDGTRLSVAVTYPVLPIYDRMFAILHEDAKACGLDLRLDALELTVSYRKEMLKQYEIDYSCWDVALPVPDFFAFLHSSQALDSRGNPKPQTNNLFVWGRPDTDALCEIVRNGRTVEEVRDAAWKLQHIIHDEGIFAPAYTTDFLRLANWRWMRWPDCENTRFSPPMVLDPHQTHVFWIDEAMRKETLKARADGTRFPEVLRIADAYREKRPASPASPPPPARKE